MPARMGFAAVLLVMSSSWVFGQPSGSSPTPRPDIQTILDQLTGARDRTVPRVGKGGDWDGTTVPIGELAPWDQRNEPATELTTATFVETFDSDRWRRECYAYQGLTHYDGTALNFTYGGEGDVLIYQFNHPAVRYGGSVAFDLLFGAPEALQLGIAKPLRPALPVDLVHSETRVVAFLPQAEPPIWLVFDGSPGNGAVIDNLEVAFYDPADATDSIAVRPELFGLVPPGQFDYDRQGRPFVRSQGAAAKVSDATP